MSTGLCTLALLTLSLGQPGPKVELLWPDGAPGAVGSEAADKPTLTHFPAPTDSANGTAVVVCPGGGYSGLAIDHEGKQIAEWLNARGISAYMLNYRRAPRYKHPAPLQDVQRALRTVRAHAPEWKLNPERIGVWGFSAGGHLASSAGTLFEDGKADSADPIERVSSRPDFMILCYPVITMELDYAHRGSRRNLLGDNPDSELVEKMSTHRQVTPRTPPTFLFHTDGDPVVVPENSVLFYLALRKAKVPAEMHIYEKGPHGVGLAARDPVLSSWPARLEDWLAGKGLLKK